MQNDGNWLGVGCVLACLLFQLSVSVFRICIMVFSSVGEEEKGVREIKMKQYALIPRKKNQKKKKKKQHIFETIKTNIPNHYPPAIKRPDYFSLRSL